jgi:hypothetical protein
MVNFTPQVFHPEEKSPPPTHWTGELVDPQLVWVWWLLLPEIESQLSSPQFSYYTEASVMGHYNGYLQNSRQPMTLL